MHTLLISKSSTYPHGPRFAVAGINSCCISAERLKLGTDCVRLSLIRPAWIVDYKSLRRKLYDSPQETLAYLACLRRARSRLRCTNLCWSGTVVSSVTAEPG